MKKSLWQKDLIDRKYDSVSGDLKTDILIIGAGMSGITTAYNLKDSKYKITLIEADKVISGATSKSTAKITYLQELKYQNIYSIYGLKKTKQYYESQKEAINIILENIKANKIKCDLKQAKTITFTQDKNEIAKFDKEEKILKRLEVNFDTDINIIKEKNLKRLIAVDDTYIFHPVKYLNGLLNRLDEKNNVSIFENSRATKIKLEDDTYIISVNNHKIYADKVVVACHYPFFIIPGLIPFRTYVEKSYLTATKIDEVKNVCAITSSYPTKSYRYHEDKSGKYFILLGESSKLCAKLNFNKNYKKVADLAKEITDNSPIYEWTNMDVMTNDFLPLIGKLDNNLFIQTGYNTWGMTNGTIAAKVISDLILYNESKYESLFSLKRKITFLKILNFLSNTVMSNIKAFLLNSIRKNPSWYREKTYVTTKKGTRVGVYIDPSGKKHKVSNVCPHLKCFLNFNEKDKTWDCPCHGSRFDIDGNVVKGPSSYNIKIDETKL